MLSRFGSQPEEQTLVHDAAFETMGSKLTFSAAPARRVLEPTKRTSSLADQMWIVQQGEGDTSEST